MSARRRGILRLILESFQSFGVISPIVCFAYVRSVDLDREVCRSSDLDDELAELVRSMRRDWAD